MNFNIFAKKTLAAFCVLALVSGCSSSNVDAHGEVKKQAYTLKYTNGDDSLKIKGKYTGKVLNEKPDGKGTFIANKGKDYFYYKGNWKNGKMNKKGKLLFQNQKVDIIEESGPFTKVGKYEGDIYNGKLSGNGRFDTENSSGIKWNYIGNFKNSAFDGQGKMTFDGGVYREGTYTKGEFTPTVSEFFTTLGTSYDDFTVSEKAKQFMNDNPNVFTDRSYDGSQIDTSFSYLEHKKNSANYGDKLISLSNLNVVQIEEFSKWNQKKVTFSILENANNTEERYYVFLIGEVPGVLDNDNVSMVGLPLTHFQYENVEGTMLDAAVIAGVNIVK